MNRTRHRLVAVLQALTHYDAVLAVEPRWVLLKRRLRCRFHRHWRLSLSRVGIGVTLSGGPTASAREPHWNPLGTNRSSTLSSLRGTWKVRACARVRNTPSCDE